MKFLTVNYMLLAASAVLLLPVLRGRLRWLAFFTINATFVASFVSTAGLVALVGLSLTGFVIAALAGPARRRSARSDAIGASGHDAAAARESLPLEDRQSGRGVVIAGIALLTFAFLYLRGYSALGVVLPEGWIGRFAVPAGLSFLFFKIIHVIVDSAAGTIGELRLSHYLLYSFNFTAFWMGPIQRYQDFVEQWTGRKASLGEGFEAHLDAVNRFLRGLVKAFVLAEFLREYRLTPNMDIESMSRGALLLRTYGFYLYLYCDFSGYCDMMIAVGSLMGVRPPENFNLPFFSRNVSEYWLRVHRSLTTWLTDYIFNPSYAWMLRRQSGARGTFLPLALSLMVTMIVAGLWHGLTFSFLVFGVVHGVFLVIARGYERVMTAALGRRRFRLWTQNKLVHAAAIFITFNVTSLAYVLFVLDIHEVGQYLRRLGGL